MSLPYYKRYPRDFIEGTIGMPLELKGAYALVLDLIYMQDGKLPDDARYISGLLGCSVRAWNGIRSSLLERGKIYVNGEFISNYRADKERETLRKYQDNQAEKAAKPRKNNDIPKATAKPARVKPEPEPDATPSGVVGRGELEGLSDRLCEAAGISDVQKSVGHLNLSEPLHWQQSGCDLEMDILPTLRRIAASGKRPASWAYYTKAVFEARDKRLSPSPSVQQQTATNPNRRRSTGDLMREMMERENGRESENLHPGDALRISANAGR